ncbi:MAG: winged helix DNA-binding protein [Methanogenium sp.]|jgi:hypothetical protein
MMNVPQSKQQLSVFLRDYGGRSSKTRGEKITIMKWILENRYIPAEKIRATEDRQLSDGEINILECLYYKYILGKMAPEFTEEDVIEVLQNEAQTTKHGMTIHNIAAVLNTSDETIRRKVNSLATKHMLTRTCDPDNKRQGLFTLSPGCNFES